MLTKKYNCIFIRVPRTGTGSLGAILNIGGGHMPIKDVKRRYDAEPHRLKWEDVFKFGFVRNPYARFVSAYYNLGYDKKGWDINEFIQDDEKMKNLWREEYVLVRPMHEYLCIEGKIAVDYVGRFEDLHNCWNHLFEKFGLDEHERRMMVTHLNRTNRPKKELTKKSKKILYEIYKKDFKIFNYDR